MPHNMPMHLVGAFVSREVIVFVRSLGPCSDQYAGRPLRDRLQVMDGSVRRFCEPTEAHTKEDQLQ